MRIYGLCFVHCSGYYMYIVWFEVHEDYVLLLKVSADRDLSGSPLIELCSLTHKPLAEVNAHFIHEDDFLLAWHCARHSFP